MATETKIETHPLQPFTDSGASRRYALATPWYADGLAVATDGRIAAWMPSEPFEIPCEGKRPGTAGLMREPDGLTYQPMPIFESCANCGGKGIVIRTECERCKGKGREPHRCDCEYCTQDDEECGDCDGKGKFTGKDAKVECRCEYPRFSLGSHRYGLQYLHKIATMGPAEYAIERSGQLWFRAGKVTGTLMPYGER
jgi:hypothetical protein